MLLSDVPSGKCSKRDSIRVVWFLSTNLGQNEHDPAARAIATRDSFGGRRFLMTWEDHHVSGRVAHVRFDGASRD